MNITYVEIYKYGTYMHTIYISGLIHKHVYALWWVYGPSVVNRKKLYAVLSAGETTAEMKKITLIM